MREKFKLDTHVEAVTGEPVLTSWGGTPLHSYARAVAFHPITSALASPFRYFNSSSEVIRLVLMKYVRFPRNQPMDA